MEIKKNHQSSSRLISDIYSEKKIERQSVYIPYYFTSHTSHRDFNIRGTKIWSHLGCFDNLTNVIEQKRAPMCTHTLRHTHTTHTPTHVYNVPCTIMSASHVKGFALRESRAKWRGAFPPSKRVCAETRWLGARLITGIGTKKARANNVTAPKRKRLSGERGRILWCCSPARIDRFSVNLRRKRRAHVTFTFVLRHLRGKLFVQNNSLGYLI